MGSIVAIGGGEIGKPGNDEDTLGIDQQIIEMAGKSNPKLLFLPTASRDSETYVDAVQNHFGKRLGCQVTSLTLLNRSYEKEELKDSIAGADLVYVGGGNTKLMLLK